MAVNSASHSKGFITKSSGDTIIKAPNAVKTYTINWAGFLVLDTILTSTWTAGSGLTVDSSSNTDTTALVTLSGGTTGTTYTVVNQIVTVGGTTEEHTFYVLMGVQ